MSFHKCRHGFCGYIVHNVRNNADLVVVRNYFRSKKSNNDAIIDSMITYTPHFIEFIGGVDAQAKMVNTALMETWVNGRSLADNLVDLILDTDIGFTYEHALQNATVISNHVNRGAFSTALTRSLTQ